MKKIIITFFSLVLVCILLLFQEGFASMPLPRYTTSLCSVTASDGSDWLGAACSKLEPDGECYRMSGCDGLMPWPN